MKESCIYVKIYFKFNFTYSIQYDRDVPVLYIEVYLIWLYSEFLLIFCVVIYLPIYFRDYILAMVNSYDCVIVNVVSLENMAAIDCYQNTIMCIACA